MAIPATHRARIGRGGMFVLGAALSALLTGAIGYHFVKESNTVMVIQQQEVADLGQFGATGAALDNAVRQFGNALASSRGVDAARENLDTAIGNHSSVVFNNMRDALGPTDSSSYMKKLNDLRVAAKGAASYEEGVQVWQKAADLIGDRKRITDRIKKSIRTA